MKTIYALRAAASNPLSTVTSLGVRSLDNTERYIFDFLLGVSTRKNVPTDSATGDNCGYEGCQWLPVRRALKDLTPRPSDVFVDLGSGRGKALLIAALLPYRRVVGVEIDKDLCRYSMRNVEKARPQLRAQQVDSITANVLEWPVPDDASVIFMFNPFVGHTFHTVLHRIFESYDRKPRTLHVIYQYPCEHDWLLSTGRVVVENVVPCKWPAHPWWWRVGKLIVSYRVVGECGGGFEPQLPRRLFRPHRAIQRWSGPNGHHFRYVQ